MGPDASPRPRDEIPWPAIADAWPPGELHYLVGPLPHDASNTDDADDAEPVRWPENDVFAEDLALPVVPAQVDEFICGGCFMVCHRSRLSYRDGQQVCRDCG